MSVITGAESPVGTPLTVFLIQLILVVVFCRLMSYLVKYIKQPTVIAEVVTGILLGPSALGRIESYSKEIFPKESMNTFSVIANIGLILFMFMVGLEIDTRLMKKNVSGALLISVSAMVAPFLLGLGSSYIIYTAAVDESVSYTSFLLFVAVAMSITAFPVLARILTELKLLDSRVGNVALSAAAVDDVTAWCILALVVAIARNKGGLEALWTFLLLIAFFGFMMFVVRPLLASVAKRRIHVHGKLSLNMVVILLVSIFICAWITEVIGVHAIFGSFILGVVVPRRNGFAAAMIERIEDLVVIIFLPLYFTYSGLRTNIGSLSDGIAWGLVILVITTACAGKLIGATVAAKLLKNSWRDSFAVGILMNTKGLVELIVLNVGLDVGVLNTKVFTIFVVMALVTTFMTTPLLHIFYLRHKKVEKNHVKKGFSVFMGINNMKFVSRLVSIATLFTHGKEHVLVKALLLNEISDRPSSYFFSEYYNMMQDAPTGKKRKMLLSDIKTNLTLSEGVDIETKTIASANIARDLGAYADSRKCDILLFETHYDVELSPKEKKFDMSASFSGFDKQFDKVTKWDTTSRVIGSTISACGCAVAVLLHKQQQEISEPKRIIFVYNGLLEEIRALKVVARMPSTVQVTVIAKDEVYKALENAPHMNVVQSENPSHDIIEESKKGYDLIVVGSARGSTDMYESEAVKSVELPVLVIFPERAGFNNDSELEVTDSHKDSSRSSMESLPKVDV